MTSGRSGGASTQQRGWRGLLPWLRVGKYIRNILLFEHVIESLKQENTELDHRIAALQRQVDDQAGQLKVLLDFVSRALDERVEQHVREAVKRSLEEASSKVMRGRLPRRKDKKR